MNIILSLRESTNGNLGCQQLAAGSSSFPIGTNIGWEHHKQGGLCSLHQYGNRMPSQADATGQAMGILPPPGFSLPKLLLLMLDL
jgi:hypothetical protein